MDITIEFVNIFRSDEICDGRNGEEKLTDNGFVSKWVRYIAQTVSCIRKCGNLDTRCAGVCNFETHFAGDEVVCLSVNEQNGDAAVSNSAFCRAGIQIESTEQKRAKKEERSAEGYGIVMIFAYFFNNAARGGIGGVRYDAGNILGKIQTCAHQHGGCAHGKTG